MSKVNVRRAVYGKLAGDTTLNGLLGAPASGHSKSIYYEDVPSDAHFPYVVFNRQSPENPTYTFKAGEPAMQEEIWLVKGVDRSESADGAEGVCDRVKAVLQDGTLSISGNTQLYLRREGPGVDYPETIDGIKYKHSGSLFRLVTE